MEVYAKYLDPDPNHWSSAPSNFIGSITGGGSPAGTFVDGGTAGSIGGATYPITGINHTAESGTAPKAYLNYIVFNKDMTTVLDMGFKRITTAAREHGQDTTHEKLSFEGSEQVLIKEPGYVYIYLSNENPTAVEVYFDDFKVEHKKSSVVQMDDYYPFGLTFNSYQRENSVLNQYQYNGKELQDELDLGWLDYGARMYMADIGRWNRIDRLAGAFAPLSPYHYAANNPVNFVDINGDYFTGQTQYIDQVAEEAQKGKNQANSNISNKVQELSAAIAAGDNDAIEAAKNDINGEIKSRDGFDQTLQEINTLAGSTQEYHISDGLTGNTASTSWDASNKSVRIDIAPTQSNALIAHELKHAYQFETGTYSLGTKPGGIGNGHLFYDLTDEVEAYNRQALFDKSSLPTELGTGITVQNIKQIVTSAGTTYAIYPESQRYPLPQDKDPVKNDQALKIWANRSSQAFRSGEKTYYPGVQ